MPRSYKEVIEHADKLAARFEELQPLPDGIKDARALRKLRKAVLDRAAAEARIAELVEAARQDGHSWSSIGAMLGTSGEAARQRYGAAKRKT